MNVVIEGIQNELYNYLYVLSGGGSSNYMVPIKTIRQKMKELRQVLTDLGNNPYMAGSYVCPWSRLGQRLNRQKTGPKYPRLRMYDYKYSTKGVWHIVYRVNKKQTTVYFTKLFNHGYNTGKKLLYPNGKPILECLNWMLRLGCMDESQVETAMQHWLL